MESLRYLVLKFLMNRPRSTITKLDNMLVYVDGVSKIIIDNSIALIRVHRTSDYFRKTIALFNWSSSDGNYFVATTLSSSEFYNAILKMSFLIAPFMSRGEMNLHFYDESIDMQLEPDYNHNST